MPIAPPSFNGVSIFGPVPKSERKSLPRARQLASSPGADGMESTDLGQRGRHTMFKGLLYGDTTSALINAMLLFESYQDQNAYVLVDTFGLTSVYVQLEGVEFTAPMFDGASVRWWVRYAASFLHLVG